MISGMFTTFNREQLQQLCLEYASSLESFAKGHNLENLLTPPVDHCAIKLFGSFEFEQFLDSVKDSCNTLSYVQMDGRRIATAIFEQSLSFGPLGACHVLEIMEPKPEKQGKDIVGFDHIEIYNLNFDAIRTLLEQQGVPFKNYANPHHKAIVVLINSAGQEIKFTDSRLQEIAEAEKAEGNSVVVV